MKISENLKPAEQIDEVVLKANRVLGMVYRNIENKNKDIMLPIYKTLVRPHLEFCIQAWNPHLVKDISKLEEGS